MKFPVGSRVKSMFCDRARGKVIGDAYITSIADPDGERSVHCYIIRLDKDVQGVHIGTGTLITSMIACEMFLEADE